jgi:segregation and condensation protein A
MDYVVKTEVFEGPFDLLLHLIARQRVDIWQVSLSRITEDYLAEMRRMRQLNLEVATEFLVVAATLLELKAARLLPAPDADSGEIEAALEERDLLFARVLQYRAYKQVAGLFGARLLEQAAYVPRRVGAEDVLRGIVPELLVGVAPADLARLVAAALTPAPPPRARPR